MPQNVTSLASLKEARARESLGIGQKALKAIRKAHDMYDDCIDRAEVRHSACSASLQMVEANVGILRLATGLRQRIDRLNDESDPDGLLRGELKASQEIIGGYITQMTALMSEGNELMKVFSGELEAEPA